MNRERLEELAKRFEAVADGDEGALPVNQFTSELVGFNMHYLTAKMDVDRTGMGCGTACCIAGWTNLLFVPRTEARDIWNEISAENALGLGHGTADELFFPSGYYPDKSPYDAGPREAAKVIRGLLETGEVDWKAVMADADAGSSTQTNKEPIP